MKDTDKDLVLSLYEDGTRLEQIVQETGRTLTEIAALLKEAIRPDDASLSAKDQKNHRTLKRVRAMADALTLQYLERLQDTIDSPASTDKQKAAVFEEIDKVMKIAKLSSDRVLLMEGKTTENIGIGSSSLPFNVVFTKTYETPPEADETTDEHE